MRSNKEQVRWLGTPNAIGVDYKIVGNLVSLQQLMLERIKKLRVSFIYQKAWSSWHSL